MLIDGLRFVICRFASPAAVGAWLGVAQWFALLARPLLSVFDSMDAFVGDATCLTSLPLPVAVLDEIVLSLCLLPCAEADLRRPWLPLLCSSDPSPEFGCGGAVRHCSADLLGRWGVLRKSVATM